MIEKRGLQEELTKCHATCQRLHTQCKEMGIEMNRLKQREQLLNALEAAGVDNWEGYGEIDV